MNNYALELLLGSGALAAIGAWLHSRIRVKEKADGAAIQAGAAPIDAMQAQLHSAQAQTSEAQGRLDEAHQKFFQFAQAQTQAMIELGDQVRTQTEALKQHMGDSSRRAEKIYDKLAALDNRLARIEGHRGMS